MVNYFLCNFHLHFRIAFNSEKSWDTLKCSVKQTEKLAIHKCSWRKKTKKKQSCQDLNESLALPGEFQALWSFESFRSAFPASPFHTLLSAFSPARRHINARSPLGWETAARLTTQIQEDGERPGKGPERNNSSCPPPWPPINVVRRPAEFNP